MFTSKDKSCFYIFMEESFEWELEDQAWEYIILGN